MFDVIVSIIGSDGAESTYRLNLVSQLEFEEIEKVGLVDAFASRITRQQELRLAWLGVKQEGQVVPADLKSFAASIRHVDARLERVPFGEAEPTP